MPLRETLEIVGKNSTKRALGEIQKDLGGLNRNFGLVTKAAGAFVAILAAGKVLEFAGAIKNATSQVQLYRNQLRLITDGNLHLELTFQKLAQAARDNRTPIAETIDLFTKLRVSTQALGKSEEEVMRVTNNLSRALQIAGADGNTAASVIRQFGQAMASGEVRGDEFRSLVEGLGPALAIMAQETGITVGELRKMSRAGELTADVMFDMIANTEILNEKFNDLQPTLAQTEQIFRDSFSLMLAALGEASGATDLYQGALNKLIQAMDLITDALSESPFAEFTEEQFKALDSTEKLAAGIEYLESELAPLEKQLELNAIAVEQYADTSIEGAKAQEEATTSIIENNDALADNIETQRQLIEALRVKHDLMVDEAEQQKAEEERIKAINEANSKLANQYKDVIEIAEKYAKQDYLTTPLEKAKAEADQALNVFNKLQNLITDRGPGSAFGTLIDPSTKEGEKFFNRIKKLMLEAEEAYKEASKNIEAIEEAAKQKTLDKFLTIKEAYETELETIERVYDNRLTIIENALADEVIAEEDASDLKLRIQKQYEKEVTKIKEREAKLRRINELKALGKTQDQAETYAEFEKKSTSEKAEFAITQGKKTFEALGQLNEKAFRAYKAFAIAEAIISTYKGAAKALGSYPPPFNFIAAAAVVAGGLAQVASIRAQTYGGRREGGPVTGGSPFLVGEDGPEIFTPRTNGEVIPMDKYRREQPVQVVFQIQANDTRGFDDLIKQRRGLIVNMINDAVMNKGKEALI